MSFDKMEYIQKIASSNVGEITKEFNSLREDREKVNGKFTSVIKEMRDREDAGEEIDQDSITKLNNDLDQLMNEIKEIDWKIGVIGKAIKRFK